MTEHTSENIFMQRSLENEKNKYVFYRNKDFRRINNENTDWQVESTVS